MSDIRRSLMNVLASGGDSGVLTGTITPEENTKTISIDVGGSFDKFAIFELTPATGYGVRGFRFAICHFDESKNFVLSTTNSGTNIAIEGNYASSYFSKSGSIVDANLPSYFIGGVSYKWFAW